jgi:stage IV sporulation protein FB
MVQPRMKFRLHPVLLPLFLFLIVTDGISTYVLIFISLLAHEAGHLLAAKLVGMRVRSCTIMPYGGELIIPGRHFAARKDRIIVALGGPVATVFLLFIASIIPFPTNSMVIKIQLALLLLNLLPILPLDGGQVLVAFLEKDGFDYNIRNVILVHSIAFLTLVIVLLSFNLPLTLPYLLLALFLLIQNILVFRFRKYEKAYAEIKINKLT